MSSLCNTLSASSRRLCNRLRERFLVELQPTLHNDWLKGDVGGPGRRYSHLLANGHPFSRCRKEYVAFVKDRALIRNLLKGSIDDMRSNFAKLRAAAGTPKIDTLGLDIKEVSIPADNGSFPARIYRPPGQEKLPVLIV